MVVGVMVAVVVALVGVVKILAKVKIVVDMTAELLVTHTRAKVAIVLLSGLVLILESVVPVSYFVEVFSNMMVEA